jgi:hypothetical protein
MPSKGQAISDVKTFSRENPVADLFPQWSPIVLLRLPSKIVFGKTNQPNSERLRGRH